MKLIRTIRLDPSDTFVFERAAEPGEWAVSGAFVFWNADAAKLRRQGALGVSRRVPRRRSRSAGRRWCRSSRRATTDRAAVGRARWRSNSSRISARRIIAAARAAAEEEVAFAESLCNHPADTLIAVHRTFEDGEVREAFRTLASARRPKPMRAFSFLEVEGEEEPGRRGRSGRAWPRARRSGQMNGFLALLRPSSARPRRGRRAGRRPTSFSRSIWRGRSSRRRRRPAWSSARCMPRCWPIRAAPVAADEIAAIADADARENWQVMIAFRDHLTAPPDAGGGLSRHRAPRRRGTPHLFLNQLVHVILRNALDGCDDPFVLRAGRTVLPHRSA